MRFVFSPAHHGHAPPEIMIYGKPRRYLEAPQRVDALLACLHAQGHEPAQAQGWGMDWIAAVHDAGYLHFLETAHARWQALPDATPVIHPHTFAHYSARRCPENIKGQVGFYLSGASSPIAAGTWKAVVASAHCALEAARLVAAGKREAYALCRPPGHHAYADFGGGFCYLNNVAIAAHYLAHHVGRVAIMDIDTHHGNGTQSIFYHRSDVHFVSVHGDPNDLFPFYAGYADECGAGDGLGHNVNLPLPMKSGDGAWLHAIEQGMDSIQLHAPAVLLVSLGFDTYKGDPSSDMAVSTQGFRAAGALLGSFPYPVVLVQEGGYVVEKLGDNLGAFLDGFLGARSKDVRCLHHPAATQT